MDKLFIPYDIALSLKEMGFDEPCFSWYLNSKLETKPNEVFYFTHSLRSHKGYKSVQAQEFVSAPLYDQVIDWFIEKHKINISVDPLFPKRLVLWEYYLQKTTDRSLIAQDSGYENQKKALQAGIKKAIELIKQKL